MTTTGRGLNPVRRRYLDAVFFAKYPEGRDSVFPFLFIEVNDNQAASFPGHNSNVRIREFPRPFLYLCRISRCVFEAIRRYREVAQDRATSRRHSPAQCILMRSLYSIYYRGISELGEIRC